jgi:HK97 family phage portal protein
MTTTDQDFNKQVEVEVDRRLGNVMDVLTKQIRDAHVSKSWEQDWRVGKLAEDTNVNRPAEQSYLVHKCVTVISNNFPQAPFVIYGPGDKPLPYNHPLYKLFERPNDTMSGFDLWSTTSTYYTLYGEAFWYLVESVGQSIGSSKIPAEIIPLDPRLTKEVVDPGTGKLLGWIHNGLSLNLDEVLQFKNTNPYNRFRGLAPMDAINIEVRSDYKASVHQVKFFDNGAIPGMILKTHPDDNSTIAELKKLVRIWEQGHKGVDKAHKVGILRGGMDYDVLGLSQKEMDFINSRNFTRDIVLSVFGVPKTLAGYTEGINRATADTQKRLFWTETIKPQMLRMQEKLNSTFFREIGLDYYGEFDLTKVDELREGFEEEVKAADILFKMGFSRNEINTRFNLGFEEVPLGDEKYISNSLTSITSPPEPAKQEPAKNLFLDNLLQRQDSIEKSLQGKIKKYLVKQRSKILKDIYTGTTLEKVREEFKTQDELLVKSLTPFFQEYIEEIGNIVSTKIDKGQYQLDKNLLYSKVKGLLNLNKSILTRIESAFGEENLDGIVNKIKTVYKYADSKSNTIAKTEAVDLVNQTCLKVFSENGLNFMSVNSI